MFGGLEGADQRQPVGRLAEMPGQALPDFREELELPARIGGEGELRDVMPLQYPVALEQSAVQVGGVDDASPRARMPATMARS